jgi:hypothetical protein
MKNIYRNKTKSIPISIFEIGGTPDCKPSFKTKTRRKRVIGSAPVFRTETTETESENDEGIQVPLKHIEDELKRKLSHDPTFSVYQDCTDDSLKIGRSKFQYNDEHVFVDDTKYNGTQMLWELLTKSPPAKNIVTLQDRQAYKDILLQSNAHRVDYSPKGRIRANKGAKYMHLFHNFLVIHINVR